MSVDLTPVDLARIEEAPPVERDVGLAAGRRVYLMEWERDALVAEIRRARDVKAEAEALFGDPSRVITSRDYADLLDALGGR